MTMARKNYDGPISMDEVQEIRMFTDVFPHCVRTMTSVKMKVTVNHRTTTEFVECTTYNRPGETEVSIIGSVGFGYEPLDGWHWGRLFWSRDVKR